MYFVYNNTMKSTRLKIGSHPGKHKNNCLTFVERRPNVFDVRPTLYKLYTNGLCLLGCINHNACFLSDNRTIFLECIYTYLLLWIVSHLTRNNIATISSKYQLAPLVLATVSTVTHALSSNEIRLVNNTNASVIIKMGGC